MPGAMTCTVVGMDAWRRNVLGLAETVRAETARALDREMVGVLEISRDLCPVESGRLAASGQVDPPEATGDVVSVYISYGGDNDVPYALIQHERLDYRHAAGKQAKFLERPLLEWTGDGVERIGRRVAGALLRRAGP